MLLATNKETYNYYLRSMYGSKEIVDTVLKDQSNDRLCFWVPLAVLQASLGLLCFFQAWKVSHFMWVCYVVPRKCESSAVPKYQISCFSIANRLCWPTMSSTAQKNVMVTASGQVWLHGTQNATSHWNLLLLMKPRRRGVNCLCCVP